MGMQMRRIMLWMAAVLWMAAECALAQEITLPGALVRIKAQAFEGNTAFENVVLSDGVAAIESRAFAECTDMETIYIPNSVMRIAENAFSGCEGLVICCEADSYAAQYAAAHNITVKAVEGSDAPDLISVTIAPEKTMVETEAADFAWIVATSYTLDGDRMELDVYMNGEICHREQMDVDWKDDHAGQEFRFAYAPELIAGDECYAIVNYFHGDGHTTQAISAKTQIAGTLSAALVVENPVVNTGDYMRWRLDTQQAAGLATAQFALYKDGEQIELSACTTDTVYCVKAEEAGEYTAHALVVDGLGREISVQGEAATVREGDPAEAVDVLRYELSADGSYYLVVGCDADVYSVDVPSERNGLPVSAVAEGAFMVCENLSSVYLPDSIERVGAYAFHGCEKLLNVTVENKNARMGEGVFSGCSNLREIPLPANMTEVPDYYAMGCGGPAVLELPEGIESIGREAFAGCIYTDSIVLPNSLTSMKNGAFSGCTGVTGITFGSGLDVLADEAFSGCTALKELNLPDEITSIGVRTFAGCSALEDIILPSEIVRIGDSAFVGCSSLKTALLENVNASIGKYAFNACPNVEVQTFGAGSVEAQIREMGYAFRNIALAVLTRAEMLTANPAVGREMIWKAEAEWGTAPYTYQFDIYRGDELQISHATGSEGLFRHVPSLPGQYYAVITVTDAAGIRAERTTAPCAVKPAEGATMDYLSYELIDGGAAYAITGIGNLPQEGAKVVIPAEIDGIPVTSIARRAAKLQENMTELVIPDSVTGIEYEAFYKCSRLKSVTIGSGLLNLGERAFYQCERLEKINLPYGLQVVGVQSLFLCTSLRDFTIPSTVESIGAEAFYGCRTLSVMEVPSSVTSCGRGIFYGCEQLKSVAWNASVDDLPGYAFYGCKSLETVEFGYPLKTFGGSAFYLCGGLREVRGRLENVERIGDYTFYRCKSLVRMTLPAKVERFFFGSGAFEGCTALTALTLDEETVLKPYGNAFYGCTQLNSITCKHISLYAPNSGAYAGEAAFANCTSLREVTVAGSLDKRLFENCTGLQKVTLESMHTIGQYAFRNCTSLNTIVFPDEEVDGKQVRYECFINTGAFQNCTGLQEVVFPKSPYGFNLGAFAFENCTGLTRIELPEDWSNRHIGEGTFRNCTALTAVSNMTSMRTVGKKAFKDCVNLTNVHFSPIPQEQTLSSTLTIGEEAFAGCRSLGHMAFDEYTIEIGENAFAGCENMTVSTEPESYAESYFADGDFGVASAPSLIHELSAEVVWGSADDESNTVDATITVYNTKNGPVPGGADWTEMLANSAAENVVITLQRSSKAYHNVWLEDSGEVGTIPYRGSATVHAKVKCLHSPAATCDHGELYVYANEANGNSYSWDVPIEADFKSRITGDWYITEPTKVSASTAVNGNIYVQSELTIENARVSCTGNFYVQQGGTVRMRNQSSLNAAWTEIRGGGEICMEGAAIYTDGMRNEGALSMLTASSRINTESFIVDGSGVLNLAADGEIETDSFLFDTATGHADLLTNGVIVAQTAQLRRGFYASEQQAFVLKGGACTLDVARTRPLQSFAALAVDCAPGDLKVENISMTGKLPFECAHFSMPERALKNEMVKANTIAKKIYDRFTEAIVDKTMAQEEELFEVMDKWYILTAVNVQANKNMARNGVFAKRAVTRWAVETSSAMPDKWDNVNDVLGAILDSREGNTYHFTEGKEEYTVEVKPLGGLKLSAAIASAGRAIVTNSEGTFTYIYSLNQAGIQKNGEILLDVIRRYGEEEFVKHLNEAGKEVLGTEEYAKYAIAICEVVEKGLIEEKDFFEVIRDCYGKKIANFLIHVQMKDMLETVRFWNDWKGFIKQADELDKLVREVRSGEALPSDLVSHYLKLVQLEPDEEME